MARAKKLKINIGGLTITADNILQVYELSNVYTKAAMFERDLGHLANHEMLLGMAINIKEQVGEQC